jgi:hypothetical protein
VNNFDKNLPISAPLSEDARGCCIFLNACLNFILFCLSQRQSKMYSTFPVYRISVWTAIEYYNPHTNKKTESDARYKKPLNRREDASLTALSNAKQVQIWVQTERSSMLIRLAYILFKYGGLKCISIEFLKLLSIDMIIKLWRKCRLLLTPCECKITSRIT